MSEAYILDCTQRTHIGEGTGFEILMFGYLQVLDRIPNVQLLPSAVLLPQTLVRAKRKR